MAEDKENKPKSKKESTNIIIIFFKKLGEALARLLTKILSVVCKYLIIFAFLHLAGIIVLLVVMGLNIKNTNSGICYEANEFITKDSGIPAYHEKTSNDYKHNKNKDVLKDDEKHKKQIFKLNGEPLKIKITGQWTPWYGNLSGEVRTFTIENDIKKNFFCIMEKYTLGDGYRFSWLTEKEDENTLYYINNYYKNVYPRKSTIPGSNAVKVFGIEHSYENQEPCWITRGWGLYMGVHGTDGKKQSTEYHQILGQTAVCQKKNWFNGRVLENNTFLLTNSKNKVLENKIFNEKIKSDKEILEYTYKNFKDNYFSLAYYAKRDDKLNNLSLEDREAEKNILSYETINGGTVKDSEYDITKHGGIQNIIYNINLHEKLLYKNNINNVGLIISNSLSKFATACYFEKKIKDKEGALSLKREINQHYFIFGPKILKRHIMDTIEKYEYGEMAKFFILDSFYESNIGKYDIEVLSGLEFDEKNSIEKLIQSMEFYLLGTPKIGQPNDRADGVIAKIFNNILNSGFAGLSRAVLVLFVAVYGLNILGLFGKPKKSLSLETLLPILLKIAVLVTITTPTGFQFFVKTFINFLVNGTIGLIDLIASIYQESFILADENMIFATGALKNANKVMSLSRNFAILDEILMLFTAPSILVKIVSFYFSNSSILAIFAVLGLPALLLYYVYKLTSSVLPFLFVLLQWAITLPLAPIMILFSFFERTKKFFTNWLGFCLGRALELFAFFISFYFWSGFINKMIQKALFFKVCIKPLSDFLFGPNDGIAANLLAGAAGLAAVTAAIIKLATTKKSKKTKIWGSVALVLAAGTLIAVVYGISLVIPYFKQIATNELFELNGQLFEINPIDRPFEYILDLGIAGLTIFLFDHCTKMFMDLVNGILTIETGENSSASGSGGAMGDSKLGLDNMSKEFFAASGMAAIQNSSDTLRMTKGFVDLDKGLAGNASKIFKNVTKPATQVADSFGKALEKKVDNSLKNNKDKNKTFSQLLKEDYKEGLKDHYFGKDGDPGDSMFGNITKEFDMFNDMRAEGRITSEKNVKQLMEQHKKDLEYNNNRNLLFEKDKLIDYEEKLVGEVDGLTKEQKILADKLNIVYSKLKENSSFENNSVINRKMMKEFCSLAAEEGIKVENLTEDDLKSILIEGMGSPAIAGQDAANLSIMGSGDVGASYTNATDGTIIGQNANQISTLGE